MNVVNLNSSQSDEKKIPLEIIDDNGQNQR